VPSLNHPSRIDVDEALRALEREEEARAEAVRQFYLRHRTARELWQEFPLWKRLLFSAIGGFVFAGIFVALILWGIDAALKSLGQ